MGHSDAFPLQETHGAGHEAARSATAVECAVTVWGSTDGLAPGGADLEQTPAAPAAADGAPEDLYHRIGHLTRTLHDAMRELGYQESLADARDNLPDARDRLAYIARLTGDAAEKVLNSVDRARTVQDEMAGQAQALRARWAAVAAYAANGANRSTPAGAALVDETCSFLASLGERAEQTNGILTDIMMAQDFHDLTGQVIRKVVSLAQQLEEQLVKLLIDATPAEQRHKVIAVPAAAVVLEGPVINPEARDDVVADQAAVDDLLASLGF